MKPQNIYGIYMPRYSKQSVFYKIFKNHFREFAANYDSKPYLYNKYGHLTDFQIDTVNKFLKCNDLNQGFGIARCPKCGTSYIIPFSCKKHKICPSCQMKKLIEYSEWLKEEVLMDVTHRHWVCTIPAELRHYFFYNRYLLNKLIETACQFLVFIYRKYSNVSKDLKKIVHPGVVGVLSTSGGDLKFNPHCHVILTEGLLSERTDDTGELLHYPLPVKDYIYISRLWRNKVLALLRNMRFITDCEVEEYKERYAYGFHVDVRFRATSDIEEREKLAQYVIRQPIGNNRIDQYDRKTGKVRICYKADFDWDKNRNIFKKETVDVLEFIARRIQHILPYHMQKVRLMGIYSNKYRGQHKKELKELKPEFKDIPREKWDTSWRRLIWKIYDKDLKNRMFKCRQRHRMWRFVDDQWSALRAGV